MTKLAMVFKWGFACFLCSPDLKFTSFLKQNFPKEMWDKIEGNKGFWAKVLFTVDLFPINTVTPDCEQGEEKVLDCVSEICLWLSAL